MDFNYSAEQEAYRGQVRAWLEANQPPPLTAAERERISEDLLWERNKRWHKKLYAEGWVGMNWPKEYGGRGATFFEQVIFQQELGRLGLPMGINVLGIIMTGPALMQWGTDAQKKRYLQPIIAADEIWCEGMSEPGAGSDLAAMQMRADLQGDSFIVNGQKVWTSGAAEADYAAALVRTDASLPKYKGLSMVIVDMTAGGVRIRPLRQMTGEAHFNEVFLDDVRVPQANLIGEYNGGWGVLNQMLLHERIALSAGTTGARLAPDTFDQLVALARKRGVDTDSAVRARLADIYIDEQLLDFMGRRMRAAAAAGLDMGPVGSIGKVGIARSARASAEAAMLVGGPDVMAWEPGDLDSAHWAHELLFFPMTGIAGGTTEIQKNTIAERLLGLPRDQQADRDLPFNQTTGTSARHNGR